MNRAIPSVAALVALAVGVLVATTGRPAIAQSGFPIGYGPPLLPARLAIQTPVYPGSPDWFLWTPDGSAVAITAANPRSGRGSLELTKGLGNGSALINETRSFGTLGTLSTFALDWFIDPTSSSSLPPDVALLVYPSGDPRSFFLVWNGCSTTSCGSYATGSWQRTELVKSLSIQQAGSNPPPARISDVPPDAPISGIHLRASYSFGQPWHGFVDNVTLGFKGAGRPTNYNFEVLECRRVDQHGLPDAHERASRSAGEQPGHSRVRTDREQQPQLPCVAQRDEQRRARHGGLLRAPCTRVTGRRARRLGIHLLPSAAARSGLPRHGYGLPAGRGALWDAGALQRGGRLLGLLGLRRQDLLCVAKITG